MSFRTAILASLYLALPGALGAHEYWISADRYQISPGENIAARTRNGQKFQGIAFPFLPDNFARFDLIEADSIRPADSILGDDPALNMAPLGEGLAIVALETTPQTVRYDKPETFETFVIHKDAAWALALHAKRGLPKSGFTEIYTRHVKALIAVGHGRGADRALGLRTEIVALANPYTDDLSGGLPLLVLLNGSPRLDAQVELFARAPDKSVTITLHRTDAQGRVSVPVLPGHEYLADAVVLLRTDNDDPDLGPVWESLWAGLSFAVAAP